MANEISSSFNLSVTKNGATFSASSNKSNDQAGSITVSTVQNIGTAAELLALGDISGVPAMLLVRNLDTANYVELALDSGMTQKFAKLLFGQFALLPPSVAAIYARANTAAVNCQILAIEA